MSYIKVDIRKTILYLASFPKLSVLVIHHLNASCCVRLVARVLMK